MSRRAPIIPSPMPVRDWYRPSRMAFRSANARAGIRDLDDEQLRRGAALPAEFDPPAPGIIEGVAGDFGDRRRDPGLVLMVEAQQPGDLPGTLPRGDRIVFEAYGEGKDRQTHRFPPQGALATTTVASSLRRVKSR